MAQDTNGLSSDRRCITLSVGEAPNKCTTGQHNCGTQVKAKNNKTSRLVKIDFGDFKPQLNLETRF